MYIPALEFAEVMKFRFDARVQASDGEAGKLTSIWVDGEKRAITYISIKLGFFGGEYFLPSNLVAEAATDQVTLSIPLEEVQQKYKNVPYGERLMRGTRVVSGGKTLGNLTQITINSETREFRHLVVDRGLRGEALVNATLVTSLSGKQIAVDLAGQAPDALTPYRPDEDVFQDVSAAIYDYQPLRIDLQGINIHVIDGALWLKGHTSSVLNSRLVEDQVQGIHGLSEVHNELVADDQLAAATSMALGRDPRTANQPIGVYPRLGEIRLRGNVRTPEARQAASEIAAKVPGAAAVMNELRVNPDARVVPVLAGVTNEEDLVPGGA